MWNQHVHIGRLQTSKLQCAQGNWGDAGSCPAKHRLSLLADIAAIAHKNQVGEITTTAQSDRPNARLVSWTNHYCPSTISENNRVRAIGWIDPVSELFRANQQCLPAEAS